MLYAFIIVLVIAIGLATGLYFQMKASHGQAEEQQKLLNDYQYKVDEQQKLLDDYRALEKNFDNIGEGYEQALLSFEKMEAEANKAKSANEALQKHCNSLQAELDALRESDQKKSETAKQVVKQMLVKRRSAVHLGGLSAVFPHHESPDVNIIGLLEILSHTVVSDQGVSEDQYLSAE